MSFDALTIMGISASILCAGLLIAIIKRNDSGLRRGEPETAPEDRSSFDSRP
ncbi:hypothetical protein [Thiocystis violacea]|uniref:hypothetical protein n=1 Tax=Thiocystis violacea TaxID=13725 RepID=UPI00190772AB|nr:hypothetical protein [Thiocystis violacea]